MPTILPKRKLPGYAIPLLVMGLFAGSASAAVALPAFLSPFTQPSADTILVQKQVNTRKHKIKLYPNANHQVLFFSVQGADGRVYQLFLFDVEGKLVKQVHIRNKETTVLNNMGKGNFLYEVFSEDERLANGQVIIR